MYRDQVSIQRYFQCWSGLQDDQEEKVDQDHHDYKR